VIQKRRRNKASPANGTVTLETIGRGKSALRWLERIQGKKLMEVVGGPS
jgi:hypothetical protein